SKRVAGGGTGAPSISTSRSGNRSGGRSGPPDGHQIAEKLPCASVSRPAKGRPCARRAPRAAVTVSSARPRPRRTTTGRARRGSEVSRLPSLSVIFRRHPHDGPRNNRRQRPCQEGVDRGAGRATVDGESILQLARPRGDGIVSGRERLARRLEGVTDSLHE